MLKKLKEVLQSIHGMTMPEQKDYILSELETWKGELVQTDDILLMGIRF